MNILPHLNHQTSVLYCLHIFIVLMGTTLGLHTFQLTHLIVPITLGTIATALSDCDDRLSIRLRNLFYICILFFGISSLLEWLWSYPIAFILILPCISFCLILLGALGQRYANISFGTILLAIYSMFGFGEYTFWYQQPSYFVMGSLWYGSIAILFYLLKPSLAVQDSLASVFTEISHLLTRKSRLFDPDHTAHIETLLFQVSMQNSPVMESFNRCKASLLTRLKSAHANQTTIHWLNLYFLAQDIYEQASANYLHYEHLQQNFSRSDLIFRIQKNIQLQAKACEQLATCILQRNSFDPKPELKIALTQLELSLQDWIKDNPHNLEIKNLTLIYDNLQHIYRRITHLNISASDQYMRSQVLSLSDNDIHGIADIWHKLKLNLSPKSALFRHAIRIALIFFVGTSLFFVDINTHGYWILLTSLFVCQMRYFATKTRLKLRTLGTLLGVSLGLPILYFVPNIEGQLLLTVIFGVCFFYLSSKKYTLATLMATLMVLLIFNLKGEGYAVILPRIIDTLIGCALAWFAVSFIWPDWNFRDISQNILRNSQATLHYFSEVVSQYQYGKNNHLTYRRARRAAHNAQTELSTMISSLSTEPVPNTELIHLAFRYLVYSHSQLSYVAALGSQRNQIHDHKILTLMLNLQHLLELSLIQQHPIHLATIQAKLAEVKQLEQHSQHDIHWQLIIKQISLLLETLPELLQLKTQLLQQEIK